MTERNYSRCRHFDTPRCPHNDNEFIRKVAIESKEPQNSKIQHKRFDGIEEAIAICNACDTFERR